MTHPVEHEAGTPWTCPRCGDTVDTFPAVSRTSSETDPIEICAACGTESPASARLVLIGVGAPPTLTLRTVRRTLAGISPIATISKVMPPISGRSVTPWRSTCCSARYHAWPRVWCLARGRS